MEALQQIPFDKYVDQITQYVEKNNVTVGISAAAVIAGLLVFRRVDMRRDGCDYNTSAAGVKLLNNKDHTLKSGEFKNSINDYEGMFSGARQETGKITSNESVEERKQRYATMVDHFYNIVTDFYEYGWGQCFHFAPRHMNETFHESIKRAEYHLANRLGMRPGMKALDVGCGVGGPMRNIAIFTGSDITGITINEYQVNIGNKYSATMGLSHICNSVKGDFQDLPFAAETFDVAYEIEATCHSPDRVKTFSGVNRVLKKGGMFAGYEWVMTDKYDANNKDHVRIKEGIEVGNALPTLVNYREILRCLEASGFEVLEYYDANRGVHSPHEIPWYDTLTGKMSLSGFRMTHVGRVCTHAMVWFLELIRIAPSGSTKISALLNATALDLVEGGQREIFTPSFFFLTRKK